MAKKRQNDIENRRKIASSLLLSFFHLIIRIGDAVVFEIEREGSQPPCAMCVSSHRTSHIG